MAGPTARMLALLSLLQARRDWPGDVLAERLEVSARTVRRDVDRLRELGYRVQAVKGPDGGYRLEAGSELPPLLFDDEQAVAVSVALQTVSVSAPGMGDAAARALATVRQVMPQRLRHVVDGVSVTPIPPTEAVAAAPEALRRLSAAIAAHETVRFGYAADDTSRPPRRIEPHAVVSRGGRWYVVGWHVDHDEWRVLRVDRMLLHSHTGARFSPRPVPGGDVAVFVEARFKGSAEANEWPCRGTAVLNTAAERIAPYLPDGAVEARGPDRCRVSLGSWSWIGLAGSFARFDADLDEVSPPELVAAFRVLAQRYAAASRP
ncbi:helix-turn-helix transcriptional regulator [Microbacterium sp. CJ88]|uniref:helix-turn-helix transcriptional regulator n=1 Tax=Microbacterium sp. CJ88 TaxID=3445672 RepID=UPI003F65CC41